MRSLRTWLLFPVVILATGSMLHGTPIQRPRDGGRDAVRTRPQTQIPVRPRVPNNLAATRPPIADALEGIFANGLQRRLGLDDDQLNQIRPALRDSLQRRNRLAQQSIRERNELNRALREERSEQEIEELIGNVDRTDRELREAREEFFRSVDGHLSAQQRARLRSELPNLEEQIRNLIERSRRQQR
jgi:hypothetical protein